MGLGLPPAEFLSIVHIRELPSHPPDLPKTTPRICNLTRRIKEQIGLRYAHFVNRTSVERGKHVLSGAQQRPSCRLGSAPPAPAPPFCMLTIRVC